MRKAVLTVTLMLLAGVFCMTCANAWTPEDARKIIDNYKDAVVNVQLVIETTASFEGESSKRENKASVTGTVIDPSGLVVASLAETNPTEMYRQFMDDEDGPKMSTRTVDVKIKTADGTEIAAEAVLRDRDLDLMFFRPKKALDKPLPYVNLSQNDQPQALDEVLVLSRMGTVASRALSTNVDRVRAVITKPRTFYVLTTYMHSSLGGPVLTMNGKPAGIMVLRLSPSKDGDMSMSSGVDDMMTVVAVPCSTIAGIAEQAKKAAPIKDTKQPAEEKPEAVSAKPSAEK